MNNLQDKHAKPEKVEKVSLICCAYNEAESITRVLTELLEVILTFPFHCEVIIVESNSTDGTREKVLEFCRGEEFVIILQELPGGKGNAVRAGMASATGDVIAIYDLDGEYDPRDLVSLIQAIESGKSSFVLGTRKNELGKMRVLKGHPFLTLILNLGHEFFTLSFNLLYKTKLSDPFTMWKVFRKEAAQDLIFVSNRFDFDFELVAKLILNGSLAQEIECSYKSRTFKQGKKIRIFYDPITWLIALIRFRF